MIHFNESINLSEIYVKYIEMIKRNVEILLTMLIKKLGAESEVNRHKN